MVFFQRKSREKRNLNWKYRFTCNSRYDTVYAVRKNYQNSVSVFCLKKKKIHRNIAIHWRKRGRRRRRQIVGATRRRSTGPAPHEYTAQRRQCRRLVEARATLARSTMVGHGRRYRRRSQRPLFAVRVGIVCFYFVFSFFF